MAADFRTNYDDVMAELDMGSGYVSEEEADQTDQFGLMPPEAQTAEAQKMASSDLFSELQKNSMEYQERPDGQR